LMVQNYDKFHYNGLCMSFSFQSISLIFNYSTNKKMIQFFLLLYVKKSVKLEL